MAQIVKKKKACNDRDLGSISGLGRSPGKGNSDILARRIPRTEELDGMESQTTKDGDGELVEMVADHVEVPGG